MNEITTSTSYFPHVYVNEDTTFVFADSLEHTYQGEVSFESTVRSVPDTPDIPKPSMWIYPQYALWFLFTVLILVKVLQAHKHDKRERIE